MSLGPGWTSVGPGPKGRVFYRESLPIPGFGLRSGGGPAVSSAHGATAQIKKGGRGFQVLVGSARVDLMNCSGLT